MTNTQKFQVLAVSRLLAAKQSLVLDAAFAARHSTDAALLDVLPTSAIAGDPAIADRAAALASLISSVNELPTE